MDTTDNPLSRSYEKKMEQISPFELKNVLIELASQKAYRIQCAARTMLNAGRGNPNWICT